MKKEMICMNASEDDKCGIKCVHDAPELTEEERKALCDKESNKDCGYYTEKE